MFLYFLFVPPFWEVPVGTGAGDFDTCPLTDDEAGYFDTCPLTDDGAGDLRAWS